MTSGELLAFERAWPRHSGQKEEAIRRELGVTPARYYVLLHRAATSLEGQAADALTAHRVTRRRAHTLPTVVAGHPAPASANMGQHPA